MKVEQKKLKLKKCSEKKNENKIQDAKKKEVS